MSRRGKDGERRLEAVTDTGESVVTLADIVEALELDLVLGRLRPRERLTEDDLMMRFFAKRHVVRNALIELERLGLVQRPRGKGAVVRDYDAGEVCQIYDFRADLHRLAVAQMSLPLPDAVLDQLTHIADQHEAAIESNDLASVIRLNNQFHDLFFDQCGNRYLSEAIGHHAALAHAIRSYRVGNPDLLSQAASEHREMIVAAGEGDRDRLLTLAIGHIEPSKQLYLKERL